MARPFGLQCRTGLICAVALSAAIPPATAAGAQGVPRANESRAVTLIHIGDIHGHLMPRPNLRSDSSGRPEGGLARMHGLIEQIRKKRKHTLLLNTGDTIQGSAEALFTRGQALVDVINPFRIDAYAPRGQRATGIRVQRWGRATWEPLDLGANYTYASYYFSGDPKLINVVPSSDISVLKDEQGNPLDGVEVVVRYLASLPERTVNPEPNRIRLVKLLPKALFGNPEIQPLRGATGP